MDALADTGAEMEGVAGPECFPSNKVVPAPKPLKNTGADRKHIFGGNEAGSDPRGHPGVTWGVYLCAGKPPLADIILSHPTDLTRCDSVIGLAIPAMSGHIQYRGQRRFIHQNIRNQQGFIIIMFP